MGKLCGGGCVIICECGLLYEGYGWYCEVVLWCVCV